ncbi:hypothetical protein [Vibrio penaeicida]|uniref:Uncharacterized protein n=1 Tax=Vibrio penaeicida TaxID=104609 RepID=A0AAV5NN93_9VIBR|nr:hypothetical protein [Vibrio penaeicida]GLQ72126.1 hypothetical protein GCM10007932_14860 [Vibrio penaeicida]
MKRSIISLTGLVCLVALTACKGSVYDAVSSMPKSSGEAVNDGSAAYTSQLFGDKVTDLLDAVSVTEDSLILENVARKATYATDAILGQALKSLNYSSIASLKAALKAGSVINNGIYHAELDSFFELEYVKIKSSSAITLKSAPANIIESKDSIAPFTLNNKKGVVDIVILDVGGGDYYISTTIGDLKYYLDTNTFKDALGLDGFGVCKTTSKGANFTEWTCHLSSPMIQSDDELFYSLDHQVEKYTSTDTGISSSVSMKSLSDHRYNRNTRELQFIPPIEFSAKQ